MMKTAMVLAHILWLLARGWDGERIVAEMRERDVAGRDRP